MVRLMLTATVIFSAVAFPAKATDPIEGIRKGPKGTLIEFAANGASQYCGTVMNGEYQGKAIGCLTGVDGAYEGEINKLDEGKTYAGKASVSGDSLKLAGCIAGGLICKSETLARQ